MPLGDRGYMRGNHPPACTCVSCVARRSGPREGRQVWRGRDVTPPTPRPVRPGSGAPTIGTPPPSRPNPPSQGSSPQPKPRKSGGKLLRLVAVVAITLLLWAGWGVWQDYREHNYFEPRRAGDVALAQWGDIPEDIVAVVSWLVRRPDATSPAIAASAPNTPMVEPAIALPVVTMDEPAIALPVAMKDEPPAENTETPTAMAQSAAMPSPQSTATSLPVTPTSAPTVTVAPTPTLTPTATAIPTPCPTVAIKPTPHKSFLVNHPDTGVEVALTKAQFDEFLSTGMIPESPVPTAMPASCNPAAPILADAVVSTPGPIATPRPTETPEQVSAPTPTPVSDLVELRRYMLDLINDARQEHRLSPVTLGSNAAAQQHAEDKLRNNYSSHWGMDGLTPYMRYTLAGGTNYEAENGSGPAFLQAGVRYRKQTPRELLTEAHEGLMQSPGHRKNILNKWHKKVNLGIACSQYTCSVVQQFEGDYVEFSEKPVINNGILSFAGNLQGGFSFYGSVQIWYHQPPHSLSLGQLDATYSYSVGQEPATFLLKPAPAGSYYSEANLRPTLYTWQVGTDPYSVGPDRPRSGSIPFRFSLLTPRSKVVPLTIAGTWRVNGRTFEVKADISEVIDHLGPGVYTVLIWGSNEGEKAPLTEYSIFVE